MSEWDGDKPVRICCSEAVEKVLFSHAWIDKNESRSAFEKCEHEGNEVFAEANEEGNSLSRANPHRL
jgi:hypothetical protein